MKGALSWGLVEWGALALIGLSALQTYRLALEQRDHEVTRREMSDQLATQARHASTVSEQYRQKEQAWATAMRKVSDDAEAEIGKARSAAAVADRAAVGLRNDYGRALAAYRDLAARQAVDASAGPAAGQAADLLADVFGGTDQAAGEIALFADLAYAASTTCWAAGEALSD